MALRSGGEASGAGVVVWHGTSSRRLAVVLRCGLLAACVAVEWEIAEYYAVEAAEEDGASRLCSRSLVLRLARGQSLLSIDELLWAAADAACARLGVAAWSVLPGVAGLALTGTARCPGLVAAGRLSVSDREA
jgi:hypothetical protein